MVKRRRVAEDDEVPRSRRRSAPADDDEVPRSTRRKKKRTPAEDDEVPRSRKRAAVYVDDDDDEIVSGELDIRAALEDAAQFADEHEETFAEYFTPEQGENYFRFMPPKKGEKLPWRRFLQHGRGSGQNFRSIVCPTTYGKPCPICDEHNRLIATRHPADKESAAQFRPKRTVVAPVVVVTNKRERALGVRLFRYGTTIDKALIAALATRGVGDFTHRKTGCAMVITREGEGMDTKYPSITATRESLPMKRIWREQLNAIDMDAIARCPTREEVAEFFAGYGGAPQRRRATGGGSTRGRSGGGASDEDFDFSAKRGGRSRRTSEVDEDDDVPW